MVYSKKSNGGFNADALKSLSEFRKDLLGKILGNLVIAFIASSMTVYFAVKDDMINNYQFVFIFWLLILLIYLPVNLLAFKYTFYLILSRLLQTIMLCFMPLQLTCYVWIVYLPTNMSLIGITIIAISLLLLYRRGLRIRIPSKYNEFHFNSHLINRELGFFYVLKEDEPCKSCYKASKKLDKFIDHIEKVVVIIAPVVYVVTLGIVKIFSLIEQNLMAFIVAIAMYIWSLFGAGTIFPENQIQLQVLRKIEKDIGKRVVNR